MRHPKYENFHGNDIFMFTLNAKRNLFVSLFLIIFLRNSWFCFRDGNKFHDFVTDKVKIVHVDQSGKGRACMFDHSVIVSRC